jgi:hypothetical protein
VCCTFTLLWRSFLEYCGSYFEADGNWYTLVVVPVPSTRYVLSGLFNQPILSGTFWKFKEILWAQETPTCYGILYFLAVFTRDPHLFVFYTRAIQSTLSEHICLLYGVLYYFEWTMFIVTQNATVLTVALYSPDCKRCALWCSTLPLLMRSLLSKCHLVSW